MFSNPGFVIRVAPLLASLMLVFSCCYLYDIHPPTPTPVPTATPACTMHFTHPANGAELPVGSSTDFSWTSVAKATHYIFSLSGPGNGASPVNYPTNNTTWPVYIDNLGGVGSYTASVQSRDADANILCQAHIQFTVVLA